MDVTRVMGREIATTSVWRPETWKGSIETHIAETLHAHTLPRERPNTRVKDLPDLVLHPAFSTAEVPRYDSGYNLEAVIVDAANKQGVLEMNTRHSSPSSPRRSRARATRSG
jgi:hypothetical protein